MDTALSRCRVVLVRPHYAGNLGATARVMRNFGLSDLVLVAPYCFPTDLEARRMARGGLAILDAARTVPDLGDALADCVYSFATSSLTAGLIRSGTIGAAAERMPELVAAAEAGPVAVVFGPEPHGLSNEEVARCNGLVHIPVDDEYGSLNLAQAVAICCYELRKAWSKMVNDARGTPELAADAHAAPGEHSLAGRRGRRAVAPFADQERMYEHLREALTAVGYLFGDKAESLMHGIRHLIGRAQPTPQEVKILHGLARQILWAAGQMKPKDEPRA
jgi:tRNA/rRNA methyltransferase